MNNLIKTSKPVSRIKHTTGVIRYVSQYTIKGNRILQIVNSKGKINIYINSDLYDNISNSFGKGKAVKIRFTNPSNIEFVSLSKLN